MQSPQRVNPGFITVNPHSSSLYCKTPYRAKPGFNVTNSHSSNLYYCYPYQVKSGCIAVLYCFRVDYMQNSFRFPFSSTDSFSLVLIVLSIFLYPVYCHHSLNFQCPYHQVLHFFFPHASPHSYQLQSGQSFES